jgi:hypothetical protein
MATDSPPKMRVSLWRDFRPERTLAYKAGGAPDAKFFQRDDQLQEEVFALHVGEGVLNGVADDDLRATITACLTEDFAPALPPSERACRKLERFFEAAQKAIESGKAEWSYSEDPAFDDEPDPYRVNMLLAFYNQLLWLHEMFKDEPGVSISVRSFLQARARPTTSFPGFSKAL